MKKLLLSAITALAFLFGFASCSGDLHDADAIDMTKLYLRGDMNEWGSTPLTDNEDGSWSVTFTATLTPQQFAIATDDDSWSTAYRGKDVEGTGLAEITASDFGKDVNLYHMGGMSNATIATEVGTEYTITITPKEGYITISVAAGEKPKNVYVQYGSMKVVAEFASKDIYKGVITAMVDGDLEYTVEYDGESLGKQTFKDAKAGKDYVVTINATGEEPSITCEQDLFNCYFIGDPAGDFQKMDVITETGFRSYTFTYDSEMTAWGGKEGAINFIVNDINSWSGNKKILCDTEFELNGEDWTFSGTNADNNCTASGLEEGKTYTLLVDISDTDKLKAKLLESPLYVIGDISEGGWLAMPDVAKKVYSYTFTYDSEKMTAWGGNNGKVNFKFGFVTDWSDSYGGNKDTPLNLTLGEVASLTSKSTITAANGGAGDTANVVATLQNGEKYTLTVDASNENALTVKISGTKAAYSLSGLTFKGGWTCNWWAEPLFTLGGATTQTYTLESNRLEKCTHDGCNKKANDEFGIFRKKTEGDGDVNVWFAEKIPFGTRTELKYNATDESVNSTMASAFDNTKEYEIKLELADTSVTAPKLFITVTEKQ